MSNHPPADGTPDALVVGSGPNGLAAAIRLAGTGRPVHMFEAAEVIGGGTRSAALTLPGFVHDVCSSIYPLAVASPFFRTLPLAEHGLALYHPPAPLAHPFDDVTAAVLERSVAATTRTLDRCDAEAYARLMGPAVRDAQALLGPLRIPHHPLALARFGLLALRSAVGFAH